MNLVITAPATTETTATSGITWVAKGGSSVADAAGRFAIRKNSKGVWRLFDGGILVHEGTKDSAKAYAAQLVTAGGTDVKGALQAGEAKVYSLRGNGTMRRRHFLTGDELAAAKAVEAKRNDGLGMAFIAGEMHVSVSAVRRILVDLAITEQLMEADASELEAMLVGAADITE